MTDPTERWLPVPGWEGFYEVSDQGRVRSLDRQITRSDGLVKRFRGRVLKQHTGSRGYPEVALSRPGETRNHLVPHLVLAAFIGPCPAGQETRHGPGGALDNRLVNLSRGTRKENLGDKIRDDTHNRGERHYRNKLTEAEVLEIRRRRESGDALQAIADDFDISMQHVSTIAMRKVWAWL